MNRGFTLMTMVLGILILGVAGLALIYFSFRDQVVEIHTEIEIEAPPEDVWQVLTNLDQYQEWNPFIVKASGIVEADGHIAMETNVPDRKPMQVNDVPITYYDEFREFRWGGALLHEPFFFAEQKFILNELPDNRTKLIHIEVFKGTLTRFLNLQTPFEKAFEKMDRALKSGVELHSD